VIRWSLLPLVLLPRCILHDICWMCYRAVCTPLSGGGRAFQARAWRPPRGGWADGGARMGLPARERSTEVSGPGEGFAMSALIAGRCASKMAVHQQGVGTTGPRRVPDPARSGSTLAPSDPRGGARSPQTGPLGRSTLRPVLSQLGSSALGSRKWPSQNRLQQGVN